MVKKTAFRLRGRLKLFTALTVAGSLGAGAVALAQTATTTTPEPVVIPGNGSNPNLDAYQIQEVKIKYKELLLRQKNIPNAVTNLGPKEIAAANPTTGSIQSLLKMAPSVTQYSQGPGQQSSTLAIRGVRNDELAETLDGVPINNLLVGSGDYLDAGSMSSPVTLNEIDGVTIYPGLAPPANQGFGTTGGTIAYTTKQPTDDRYEELEGGYGSFDTSHVGFVINTGKMGDDVDAPKAILLYDQSQTAGYVDYTPAQYHDFMFNIVKPYNDGLSKLGLVIIYNQGKGYIDTLPTPTALIDANSRSFNFPYSEGYNRQSDQDLTTILSDETYINQYAIFDGSLFFLHQTQTNDSYGSEDATTNGYTYNGITYAPNIQAINSFYGCVGAGQFRSGPQFTYDPVASFGSCGAGESDSYSEGHDNIIGITPKLTLYPDAHNTVVIGGLISKASANVQGPGTSNGETFVYGGSDAANNQYPGYNSFNIGGGAQRTIYSGYVQDTIRAFDNKLQITPGVTVNAAYSSNIQQTTGGIYNPVKLQNYTAIGGYYLGASYNLPHDFVLYGSLGKGSLFSDVNDYSQGTTDAGLAGGTNAPTPEIVHLYEGGIRYDTPRLLLNVDYYYQTIDDAFAFFEDYATNQQYYANNGGYLFRGVEGNGEFRVTPSFSIFGNFSYNEAQYTKSFFASDTLNQDQFGYAYSGTPLSNVPQWNGLVGADYEIGGFTIFGTGQYTGREFTTEDLDAPPYGDTYEGPDMTAHPNGYATPQPGYSTTAIPANPLNAATVTNQKIQNPANFIVNILLTYKIPLPASIPLKSLTASLNMQNIFNKAYYTYTYSSRNPVGGIYDPTLPGGAPYNSAFIGEPRSFLLDMTAKF